MGVVRDKGDEEGGRWPADIGIEVPDRAGAIGVHESLVDDDDAGVVRAGGIFAGRF